MDFYHEFFPDHFYLTLTRTGRPDEERYIQAALALAEQEQLPVVATNDVCFLQADDFEAHEIRVAIHDGFTLDDPKRPKNYTSQQYFRSEQEMCDLFADVPSALENTLLIAQRCNVTIRLGEYFLPKFPTGDLSTEDYLVKRAKEGLEERLKVLFPDENERAARRPEYDERLQVELDVINQMGFPGYFLIVMEFIQWSKDNDIPVGPGRGSGGLLRGCGGCAAIPGGGRKPRSCGGVGLVLAFPGRVGAAVLGWLSSSSAFVPSLAPASLGQARCRKEGVLLELSPPKRCHSPNP